MGWIASILLLLGGLIVGYKKRFGFVVSFFGNALWAIVGYNKLMYDLVTVEIIFCIVNIWCWNNWRKIDKETSARL